MTDCSMNVNKINYNDLPDRKCIDESNWNLESLHAGDEVEYVFWFFWDNLRRGMS